MSANNPNKPPLVMEGWGDPADRPVSPAGLPVGYRWFDVPSAPSRVAWEVFPGATQNDRVWVEQQQALADLIPGAVVIGAPDGSATQDPTITINPTTHELTLPVAPVAPTDAANKAYADSGDAAVLAAAEAYTDTGIATRVPTSRTLTAGTGLTGGGTLAADRTFAVDTAVIATRAYADGVGTAAVSAAQSYTDTAVATRVPTSRTVSTTAPLTGGGALSANLTLAISAATTIAPGSMSAADKVLVDALPTTYVPLTRTLTAGTGLTGGGTLAADRSFAVDTAVIATRAYADSGDTAAYVAAAAYTDTAVALRALKTTTVSAGTGLTGGGDLSANRTLAVDYSTTNTWTGAQTLSFTGTALTLGASSNASFGGTLGVTGLTTLTGGASVATTKTIAGAAELLLDTGAASYISARVNTAEQARIAANVLTLGNGAGTTSLTAFAISGAAGTGTNVAGADITLNPILGTGAGTAGGFIVRVAVVASGSTQHTLNTVATMKSSGVTFGSQSFFTTIQSLSTLSLSGTTGLTHSIGGTIEWNTSTGVFVLGAGEAGTPAAYKLRGANASAVNDRPAQNFTIAAGLGRGAGAAAGILFNAPLAVASGTGVQTDTLCLTVKAAVCTFAVPVKANTDFQMGYTDNSGTPGNNTANTPRGRCAIAALAQTVVVTNSLVTAASTILPIITGAGIDATLTGIVEVTPAAGSFTIRGNAASTAAVQVDWVVVN